MLNTPNTRRVEAFQIKSGPSQSGAGSSAVGGEGLPVDKLSVFLSQYWILILLIIIFPVAFVLYKKGIVNMKFLTPLVSGVFKALRYL